MDINVLGIGSIIGALIVVGMNIFLHYKNRKDDLAKERLIHLYNPLNALINKKFKYLSYLKNNAEKSDQYLIEFYKFFMELQDIYLKNEVYASVELRKAFHTLGFNHEMEYYNYSKFNDNKDEIVTNIAKFELLHQIDENGYSKIERNMDKFIEVVKDELYQIYH